MFSVLACIRDDHDWRLIGAAAVVCALGSLATMLLLSRAQECTPQQRRYWTIAASFGCGMGIWATHFIAMLAYDGGLPISFGVAPTVLSIVFAIASSWIAISVALRTNSGYSFAAGGLTIGVGVAAMHFTGMYAIEAAASMTLGTSETIMAIVLGTALCAVAFIAYHRIPGWSKIPSAASLLVLGICALHFTSMSGVVLAPDPLKQVTGLAIDRNVVAGVVGVTSIVLMLLTLSAVFIDRHLTDLRGFANASLEGLLIIRDGHLIDANERFVAISGWPLQQVIGKPVDAFLTFHEAAENAGPQETVLSTQDDRHIAVEIVGRSITYRGRDCRVLVVRDLTERRHAQQMIEHLAHHDMLTDLPNRSLFDQRLRQALQKAERRKGKVAVFYLDLDRFKTINDIFGHAEGDRILRKVAAVLGRAIDGGDTVARLGGDEFAILQAERPQPDSAHRLAERILAEFAAEMDTARDPTAVGVSIGVAIYPQDGHSAEQLCSNADTALYRAKHVGRGGACFFDADMDQAMRTRRQLESDLRQAVLRKQLYLSYQPIIDAQSGTTTGYEALLRWRHPTRGMIEPGIFIPIAEESGSIIQIGEWVLEQACLEASRWDTPMSVAVNIAPVQFLIPTLYDHVIRVLASSGLDPRRLELEITEAALARDRAVVLSTLKRLHAIGVRVVMDDFGTGYSSLSNLRAFPFDKIKVDRSFTGALERDPAARSIVRAIIGLGQSLDMPVVTEGVETEAQRRIVTEEGCTQIQGLLVGMPDIEPSVKLAGGAKLARLHQKEA